MLPGFGQVRSVFFKIDIYERRTISIHSTVHNADLQYRHTLSWYGEVANLHIQQLKSNIIILILILSSFIWSHVVAIWQIEAQFSHIFFALLLVP